MEYYVGLDVSLKQTSICVVDQTGSVVREAVVEMQINKSDRNDAIGIARIMQTGWFKEVHVKDIDSHSVRALLASRALLVKIKCDLENHVRGLLKNLGLVIGRAKFNVFAVRVDELIEGCPELVAAVRPLLEARNAVEKRRCLCRLNQ